MVRLIVRPCLVVLALSLAFAVGLATPLLAQQPPPTPKIEELPVTQTPWAPEATVAPAPLPAPAPDPATAHIPTIAELTPAMLSAIVSAIISLLFRFIPSLSTWLDQYSTTGKQTFMLAVALLVGAFIGIWNLAHTGLSEQSVVLLLLTMYTSLTSNQTTYSFIKPARAQTPPQSL